MHAGTDLPRFPVVAMDGYDTLPVRPHPRVAVIVFGTELLTAGRPQNGRIRDGLGPQLPAWLCRLGAVPAFLVRAAGFAVIGPGPAAASRDRVPLLPLPVAPSELA